MGWQILIFRISKRPAQIGTCRHSEKVWGHYLNFVEIEKLREKWS